MSQKLNHVDLFSGIGGFALGLNQAGIKTDLFCEYEPHLQRVIRKNWPDVEIAPDVCELHLDSSPFIMTGGFPCQDISRGNYKKNKKGIKGERSGLWKQYARRFVVSIRNLGNRSSCITNEIPVEPETGAILATYKASTSRRIDTKTFKECEPELYREYSKESTSRRFLLK